MEPTVPSTLPAKSFAEPAIRSLSMCNVLERKFREVNRRRRLRFLRDAKESSRRTSDRMICDHPTRTYPARGEPLRSLPLGPAAFCFPPTNGLRAYQACRVFRRRRARIGGL